jgi:hypothetical protein
MSYKDGDTSIVRLVIILTIMCHPAGRFKQAGVLCFHNKYPIESEFIMFVNFNKSNLKVLQKLLRR